MKTLALILFASSALAQTARFSRIDTLTLQRWVTPDGYEIRGAAYCDITNDGNADLTIEVTGNTDSADFETDGILTNPIRKGEQRRLIIRARRTVEHDTFTVISILTNDHSLTRATKLLTVYGRGAQQHATGVSAATLPPISSGKWYDAMGRVSDCLRSGVYFSSHGKRKTICK